MSNIWMIGDTHFGHKNIVRGESMWENKESCRDYNTLEEHDLKLLENINKIVKHNDVLYHHGDFSMGGKDNVWKYRRQINCKNIIFIKGNHDNAINKNQILLSDAGYINAQSLFNSVHEILEKKIGKTKIVMCHYPIYSYHKMYDNAIHTYAHTHKELNYNSLAVCVSVECHPEFRPFHIDEIREIVSNRNPLLIL